MMFKMIIDIFSQNYNSGLFRGCWNPAPPRGRSKSEGGLLDNYHNMIMILTHILTMLTILMILMIRTSLATPPSTWPPAPTMFLSSPSCSGGASRRISHIIIIIMMRRRRCWKSFLFRAGTDLTTLDNNGRTPLQLAQVGRSCYALVC